MAKLRIFLADDHAVVREGLKVLINNQPDMEVIGEAGDGAAAMRSIPDCYPDVVVMDISMPGINGVRATQQLRDLCGDSTKVLALSVHEEMSYMREMLAAGASGYVLKRAAADTLIQAIRVVASGEIYLDAPVTGALISVFVEKTGFATEPQVGLSDRETDVLRLIAQGYSNKEIAAQLGISVKTVETYKARAMEKLQLAGRADIVRYALQQGWLG